MIAATRDTSTRSTPTPIAVTARRSEAEARREPCGGGQVAAQHQSEPYQRHAERGGHALARPAHRGFPRVKPGAPAHRVQHAVAILARGGGPGFAAQLYHARRELFANVVERYPRLLQAAGHEYPAERRRELGNTQRHGDLHGRAHRARRAARPVRASNWATKYGSDSGRKRSRARPVAAIACSISDGSPSTSSNTSIAGYHSRRSTAWPSRYTSTRRSMRSDTANPSCSKIVTTESGAATRASVSARWRYRPRCEGGPFHPSTP